jgi:hypothetical protein
MPPAPSSLFFFISGTRLELISHVMVVMWRSVPPCPRALSHNVRWPMNRASKHDQLHTMPQSQHSVLAICRDGLDTKPNVHTFPFFLPILIKTCRSAVVVLRAPSWTLQNGYVLEEDN